MSVHNQVIEGSRIASQLRKTGYKTLLDAQPEMRARFIELHNEGLSFRAIRKTLCDEFSTPEYHVPSRIQLQAYVRNHLQVSVVIEPYTPDYNKLIRKLDPIREMANVAGEAKKKYQLAVKARASLTTQSKLLMNYSKVLSNYQTMLDRSGVARRAGADNYVAQNHLHLHQHQQRHIESEWPEENAKRMLTAMERLREQARNVVNQET